MTSTTPPAASPTLLSRRSSGRSTPHTNLSLDLSSLPPLSKPAPPSNTLLITNLEALAIFHPASLATIRQYISDLVPDQLHSFSPLRSLRRIVCSFYSVEAAIKVRQELDGTTFLGANSPVSPKEDGEDGEPISETAVYDSRARIYFGEPTPVDNAKQYLDKPDAGKLFFISPPPSPPVGWESIKEGPPNTDTHASDLQLALEKLGAKFKETGNSEFQTGGVNELEVRINNASISNDGRETKSATTTSHSGTRTRSGSTTVIYDPKAHGTGGKNGLPAVLVEDTTDVDEDDVSQFNEGKRIIAHTTRPPVELMEE